jgi:hypothetical protein
VSANYLDRYIAALPEHLLRAYLNFLEAWLSDELRTYIMDAHAAYGEDWPLKNRFYYQAGMEVRSALIQAGYHEAELPEGTWDDYYVPLLEIVVGLRPNPLEI